MTAPSFPEDEIRRDKEQMLTALDARKDNVLQTTARALTEALFLTHPMRLDSLGTPQSLEKIKRADLISVFDRYVRPDNGVISVFGDIDSRKVLAELERRLGRLKSGKPVIPVVSEPAPEALRFRQLSMEKEQAAVMIGFRGPLITDQDRFALDVGVNILSSSLGGRLFKRVREELGKSYALSGAVSPGIDAGTVTFFTLTTPDGAARVRAIMEEEFAKISSEPVAAKELADAKTFLVSRAARDQQTMDAQGMTRAVDELLGLGYANIDAYARNIDAVSSDDVLKAAKRYLDIRHAVVVVTLPSAQKQGE
jgi:zinc protease